MYHIGSYHVKYFTTKNIIIQVTIIPPKTIHLSYREIERQGWREKKSNRVMPRARKFESREKYYIDGKKEKISHSN